MSKGESAASLESLILDHIDAIVYVVRLGPDLLRDGKVEFVGGRTASLIGYTPEDFANDPGLWFSLTHPDDAPAISESASSIRAGHPFTREYRLRDKRTGDYRWVEDRVVPQHLPTGELVAIFGVARDVTEVRRMHAGLEQAERLATSGLLAAAVAHEINNALAHATLSLGVLETELDEATASSSRTLELVREASCGVQRVRTIARDLSTLSRGIHDSTEKLCLVDAVQTALRLCRPEIDQRARLIERYDAHPSVVANQGRLVQIFLNLLLNACHALGTADPSANTIRARVWEEGDFACVAIDDTGHGIDSNQLGRIFEPFFSTDTANGSGLGLWICRNLVEVMHGSIDVESERGAGSSFVVRLPIDRSKSRSAVPC